MAIKLKSKSRGFRGPYLNKDDRRYALALQAKYPEMNIATIIRRALRELAQKEQVA